MAKKKTKSKKKRTPAQIEAFKRMIAANKAKKAGKKTAKKAKAKAKAKKKPAKKAAKKAPAKKSKPKKTAKKSKAKKKAANKKTRPVAAKPRKSASKRSVRVKVAATSRYAGHFHTARVRKPDGQIVDVRITGKISYAAGNAYVIPTTGNKFQVPFDTPGSPLGEFKGEVLSLTYRWSGTDYTHSFNGRLPQWVELPGGVYCAMGLAWSHARGFRDAA